MNDDPDAILERFAEIGISARKFEEAAGLPRNFISRARAGDYRSDESEKHWKKAARALENIEKRPRRPAPKAKPSREVPPELDTAIKNLKTEQDAIDLIKKMLEFQGRGLVSNSFVKTANEALSRFQQLTRQARNVADAQRAGEKVEVVVTTVADWRKAGPCPYCSGTGKIDPEAKVLPGA